MRNKKSGGGFGIIGGVGPLASAEFLKTIYEQCQQTPEQQMPRVFMCSDPSFPARSETRFGNSDDKILGRLQQALDELNALGVSRVVICCVTMHHLLPRLSPGRRKNIISLVDLVFEKLAKSPRRHIVLCSTRTSQVRLFQQHPRWPSVQKYLVLPDEQDQRQVHDLIFHLKPNGSPRAGRGLLDRFAKKYGAKNFVCGCTEMHLLAKWFQSAPQFKTRYTFLDPLLIIAKSLAQDHRR